jgi:phenylacetate-coenzyme A ligase PaaK-like adenylate-forming protein
MHPHSLTGLRDLLEHARRSTRYHAEHLPPLGQPLPDDVDAFLERLPLLTRQDLRRHGPHLRSLGEDTSGWRVLRTTGTTGEPAEVVLDPASQAADALALAAHIDRCLGGRDWRTGDLLHLALHAGAASRTLAAPWHERGRTAKWNLLRLWQAGDDVFLPALAAIHDQIVTTLPAVAELLARRVSAAGAGRTIRPALVLLAGQAIEPEIRNLVMETFGCPVSSLYTLAEAGIVAAECAIEGDYHVEGQKVVVEVVDEGGRRLPPGQEGEVVVTPLANRAMPLLRYRTGDRAAWLSDPCSCGRPAPRLRLARTRRAGRLVTTTGATVHVVRFAKLLAALDVEQFAFDQTAAGLVRVSYRACRPLESASRSLVEAAVRAALGPLTDVRLEHVPEGSTLRPALPPVEPVTSGGRILAEPAGPDQEDLVRWLRGTLEGEAGLASVVMTGSALDPDVTTRFSDVDVALLFRQTFDEAHWLDVVRRLRRHVPDLSLHPQRLDGLPRRAPLFTCRLLCEHRLVLGRPCGDWLDWPLRDDLRAEGRFWLVQAGVAVWQRLTDPDGVPFDPIREAWVTSKYVLNALRYHYLVRGERETSARAVVARARQDSFAAAGWFADFLDALHVSREQKPPPLTETLVLRRYYTAALACLRTVASGLDVG